MKLVKFSFFTLPAILTIITLPAQAQQQIYTYQCNGGKGFQAEFLHESAKLTLPNQNNPLTLPQVVSASGVSYSDGRTMLFTKGEEAFIEVEGETAYQNCLAQVTCEQSQQTNVGATSLPTRDRTYHRLSHLEQNTSNNTSATSPLW